MTEDLFGLGLNHSAGIIKDGSAKPENARANEAWSFWCKATHRPKREMPDRRFIKTYIMQHRDGKSFEQLDSLIDGAARMAPVARDSSDVRRALKAMTEKKAGSFAASAVKEDLDYVECPLFQDEDELLCSIEDIANAIDLPVREWSNYEQEQASIILTLIPTDELVSAVKKTKAVSGRKFLMPSDIIRWRRAWKDGQKLKIAENKSRDTYTAGSSQRESFKSVDKDSDFEAGRLIVLGFDPKEVLSFHNDVPEGYWVRYSSFLEETLDKHPNWDVSEAHDEVSELLRTDYNNWTPSQREMPNG